MLMATNGPSINAFLARRPAFFQNEGLEGSYLERIARLKERMVAPSAAKPFVVISGAGPAGLMRAIQSISNGNRTIVIEKRTENALGLANTVVLDPEAIRMLKYGGIYQYLIENRLIFPPDRHGFITVRLMDLGNAMKAVVKDLSDELLILYDSKIESVRERFNKIDLVIESNGERSAISAVEIFVNAEGSRSTTNALLQIGRKTVLAKVPVIAAIYKDTRPEIRGIKTFFEYLGKSMYYTAKTISIHVQFIFSIIFFKSFRNEMSGSLILKTPMQTYLGAGFSDEVYEKIQDLQMDIDDKRGLLGRAPSVAERKRCEALVARAEKKYHSYVESRLNFSLCLANMISVLARVFGRGEGYCPPMSWHRSIDSFTMYF